LILLYKSPVSLKKVAFLLPSPYIRRVTNLYLEEIMKKFIYIILSILAIGLLIASHPIETMGPHTYQVKCYGGGKTNNVFNDYVFGTLHTHDGIVEIVSPDPSNPIDFIFTADCVIKRIRPDLE